MNIFTKIKDTFLFYVIKYINLVWFFYFIMFFVIYSLMFNKVSAGNDDELNPKDPTFLIDTISTVLFAQAKEHGWMPGVDYNYMLGKTDLSCYNVQFQKLICCLQDFLKVEKIKTDLIYIVNSDMDMHVVRDRGLEFIEQCRHYKFNRDDIIQPYLYDSMVITLDRLIKAKLNSS